jgi:outer membrane immunogenic protein
MGCCINLEDADAAHDEAYFSCGAFVLTIGGQALAADLNPSPRPPAVYVPPAPPWTWTGFYFGGNLGAGWSNGSISDTVGNTFTPNSSVNFLGGGQVGYNYQFVGSGVVVGAEADFDWAGNHNNTSNAAGGVTVSTNDRWLTTLTGRLGYAWNTLLVYGKGGGAWVGSSDPTITNVTTGASITPSTSNSNFGWTLGAGVEWAFWHNWSARLEYDFIGLNSQTFTIPAPGFAGLPAGDQFTGQNRNFQMVNVGVNYKFNSSGY